LYWVSFTWIPKDIKVFDRGQSKIDGNLKLSRITNL